jgi:hypothetical protein
MVVEGSYIRWGWLGANAALDWGYGPNRASNPREPHSRTPKISCSCIRSGAKCRPHR